MNLSLDKIARPDIFIPPPHYIAFPDLKGVQGLFFTARRTPDQMGLNCALGKSSRRAASLYNRALVAQVFNVEPENILTTQQCACEVKIVDRAWNIRQRPKAHSLVAGSKHDYVIAVLSNDCAPVLFADAKKPIIGAAHIGWREAAHSLLERTVQAMINLGSDPEDIHACIGPCAGVEQSYAVGAAFCCLPPNSDQDLAKFISWDDGKSYFAFQDYLVHRLGGTLDSRNISTISLDTILSSNCYSFRRGGPHQGCMLSGIRLMHTGWD